MDDNSTSTSIAVEAADVFSVQAVEFQRGGNVILPTSSSAADRAEYYKAYDPMTGLRIASTLSGLFALAVLYVVYKAKCRRPRLARHTSLADPSAPSEEIFWSPAHWDPAETFWETSYAPEEMVDPDNYSINKSTNRYYADDSEMPSWKVYAKDLFLYGGPGLFRSTGLQGSAPLPLTPQSSIDRVHFSYNSLRAKSLSGSVMGTLSIPASQLHRPYASSTKVDAAHLKVPAESWTAVSAAEILMAEMQRSSLCRKKTLPVRSVSFRESDMVSREQAGSASTAIPSRKPGLPPRTNSLRGSSDYVRLQQQPRAPVARCASLSSSSKPNVDRKTGQTGPGVSPTPLVSAVYRETSFQSRTSSQEDSSPSLKRTILTHRIPLAKKMPERSSSLNESPHLASQAGWRSAIRQMMRAKSTSGHSVRAKEKSKSQLRLELNLTPAADAVEQPRLFEAIEHIDICVIQPTPAVSPCASVKTLCSDSMENASSQGSVSDRRRRFAHQRAKGQTIDLADESSCDSLESQSHPTHVVSIPRMIPPSSLLQIPSVHMASNLSLHRLPPDPSLDKKSKTHLEVPKLQLHPDHRKSKPVTSPSPLVRRQQRSYSVEKNSSSSSINRPKLSRQWSTMLTPTLASSASLSYEKLEQNHPCYGHGVAPSS